MSGQGSNHREPIQLACLFVCSNYIKECMGILKSLNIVNLHRVMSMLKLGGFCLDLLLRVATVNAKPTKLLKFAF